MIRETDHQAPVDEFELYDLAKDPFEKTNLITSEREKAVGMKTELDDWIDELNAHPNNHRIHYIKLGTPEENPVRLNRNDAKGPVAPWNQPELNGYWDVEIMEDGMYDFTFNFYEKVMESGNMVLKLYPYHYSMPNSDTVTKSIILENLRLHKGTYRLEPHYTSKSQSSIFPFYVEVEQKN